MCIPGRNISVAGAQLSADSETSDNQGKLGKMGKFYQQMFATDVMNACCFFFVFVFVMTA